MPITEQEIAALEHALWKRGFRQDDAQFHDCNACGAHKVASYVLRGRSGGRDIGLCRACGVARSFRSVAGFEERVEDKTFDLKRFLE